MSNLTPNLCVHFVKRNGNSAVVTTGAGCILHLPHYAFYRVHAFYIYHEFTCILGKTKRQLSQHRGVPVAGTSEVSGLTAERAKGNVRALGAGETAGYARRRAALTKLLTVGPPQCSYGLAPRKCLYLRIHSERGYDCCTAARG